MGNFSAAVLTVSIDIMFLAVNLWFCLDTSHTPRDFKCALLCIVGPADCDNNHESAVHMKCFICIHVHVHV